MMAIPSSIDPASWARATACSRTLAGYPDLEIPISPTEKALHRGITDAAACHYRFRLPRQTRNHRPSGLAGSLFDALDQARSEALGARWLAGIGSNLATLLATDQTGPGQLQAWAFANWTGRPTQGCPEQLVSSLAGLSSLLNAPDDFAREAHCLSLSLEKDGYTIVSGCFSPPLLPAGQASREENKLADQQEEDPNGTPQAAANALSADENETPGVAPPPLPESLRREYRVFTTRHDRIVRAEDLATAEELLGLRAKLDSHLVNYRRMVAGLAHRLQRLLLARQLRHWSHDREEGMLDPSRLARMVASPCQAQVFRIEEEGLFRQTAVTLLIDNSGSMRGHPIAVAALTADILAHSLERCGIKVEILGYTTANITGGLSANEWEEAGRPHNPGRLNALRHIVYKAMDVPCRRARANMGLMLKEGLLNENVDGEALYWAYHRLSRRTEPKRLLIVISDGAPMDRATLAANPRNILDRHLHETVAWIEARGDVKIGAIGIGHQVERYYRHAISLCSVDDLGSVLTAQLGKWLT
ncbi:MAG: CobT protein [Proteobacteria bacterium]|nr:CobT protein [Pseudomonadota bacterium]